MKLLARAFVLFFLGALAVAAQAAEPYVDLEKRLTPEQMHATGLDTLTAEQIAALNALLRGETSVRAAREPHEEDEPGRAGYSGPERSIAAHVQGTLSGWDPDYVFALDNGQRWKVLKGSAKLRAPLTAPEVKLVPGLAGRWFLEVTEELPKARVYRVD